MISKVKFALKCANINNESKIAVAFSGGCDSIALLHSLNTIKTELGFSLCAIHINHLIRGNEAKRDADFAQSYCKSLGLECYVHRCDVPDECKKTGESTELCARRLRYEILDCYVQQGFTVVTAHTSSDNSETVLFNLTRGTGIKGLCGIPFERDGYLRPILECSRETTEEYCKNNRIPYITDSTNLSDDYTRNFIRHNVIPELKRLNPSLESAVTAMSHQLREIDAMLDDLTEKAFFECRLSATSFDRAHLLSLEKPILSRLMRKIIFEFTSMKADNELTERACSTVLLGKKTQLFKKSYISATKTKVIFYNFEKSQAFCIPLEIGEFEFDNFKINITSTHNVNKLLMQNAIDCDKIIGDAVIRNRLPGDSLKLSKRPSKPLRKLMNELEIPAHIRDGLPMIADDEGVIFSPYIGTAERVCVNESSKNLIIVSMEGNDND